METSPGSEERSSFTLWQRAKLKMISCAGWVIIWLIGSTIRFHFEDREALDKLRKLQQPVIFSFWHNQILCQTYLFRFQQIVVMTSQHFDGEYIGRIIEKFGYRTARGSSSRGAVRALLRLRRHLNEGRDVAFTVDGPRGPAYQVKPGPVFLARKSGVPLITLHSEPKRFWELKSWDQFRIPKPFTSALVKFGQPLHISAEEGEASGVLRYQAEMDRIKLHCEEWRERLSA